MKKEKKGNVTFLQAETDEDIDYLFLTNGLIFFRDKKKKLYCEDYLSNVYVVFNNNEWIVLSDQEIAEVKKLEKEDVEFHEMWQQLKEKNTLPIDAINEGRKIRNSQYQEYWNENKKNVQRKVIGWASIFSFPFANLVETDDEDDSHFSALVRDISECNYLFAGDEIELIPIFDDYTVLHLSSRMMGQAMALAHGYNDPMDYALFAWGGRLYDDVYDYDDAEFPVDGPYADNAVVELDNDFYEYIVKYIDKFWESEYAPQGYEESLCILPLPIEGTYWSKNGLTFKNKDNGDSFVLDNSNFLDIRCVRNEEELKAFVDETVDSVIDKKKKYLFTCDYDKAREMLKHSEIILLAIKSL